MHMPSRREVLRLEGSGFGCGRVGLPTLLRARQATSPGSPAFGRARSCILLFMWGGPAQQETWDLKPKAPGNVRGEFRPISTNVPGG